VAQGQRKASERVSKVSSVVPLYSKYTGH
jgi:hypothetical protein